jgi:ABC-type nitrate/sulfonate/bicarbonate transport system substrate-binding protein
MDAAVLSVEQRYVGLDKGMREMFFFGNEVKNSWGTLATTDKLIKENPKMISSFVRAALKSLRYMRQDKEGTVAAMMKFAGVSQQQATRVYEDLIGTFTRNGAVDEEAQKNDLSIIRQVVNAAEAVPNNRAYDFSFALQAEQQLNKTGWKP